ncbi:hypothetical protein FB45DRAFT_965040 [Roridomyces roridus]|uniref:Nephrocystin 3-like N-terminal domain-containing protein n=1 Tax=Roridomyces roridus TaxID=1738132 RepID=A0AAD7AXG8_9AGAR|nr:hypothetical protein FB45DRAFT_965040 [Roridomyces roridus]
MTVSADALGDWSSEFAKAKEITATVLQIKVGQDNDRRMDFIEKQLANHVATRHKLQIRARAFVQLVLVWKSRRKSGDGYPHRLLAANVSSGLQVKQSTQTTLFPTIAKQLAEFSPAAARIIHDTLKNHFPSSLEDQVKELLLAPIREICKSHDRVVILIDALDELQDAAKSVEGILSIIAPKGCDLPDYIRFIITSRPEHWAVISKSKTLELSVFKQDALMTDSSKEEVHNFIVARMKEIAVKEDWDDWPTLDQLDKLSRKADGLFHYATTALQWIEQQIDNIGRPYREKVFDEFAQSGIGQLKDLYKLILGAAQLGFQHVPLTIDQIIALLGDIPRDAFDVIKFLRRFRSVLIPGTTASFEEATPQIHKSFRDYIIGVHAPAEFCILTGHAHMVTARSCMEVIVKAGIKPDPKQQDAVQQYSVDHWHQHLRKAVEEGATLEDKGMQKVFEQMAEDRVVNVWKGNFWQVFIDVAATGWGLLKEGTKEDKIQGLSDIVRKVKDVRAFPLLPVLPSLTVPCLLTFRDLIAESGTMAFLKRGINSHPPLSKYLTQCLATLLPNIDDTGHRSR